MSIFYSFGLTPLHEAARGMYNSEIVSLLIENGANRYAADK